MSHDATMSGSDKASALDRLWLAVQTEAFGADELVPQVRSLVDVTDDGALDLLNDGSRPSARYNRLARAMANVLPGQVITHLDGDATNNDPANLRIVDARENVRGGDV